MIGREYEQYLISAASAKQGSFNPGFWLVVTVMGLIVPLLVYMLNN